MTFLIISSKTSRLTFKIKLNYQLKILSLDMTTNALMKLDLSTTTPCILQSLGPTNMPPIF